MLRIWVPFASAPVPVTSTLNDSFPKSSTAALGRSPALSNDRCAASNAAAVLRRDSSELTGRSRCRAALRSGCFRLGAAGQRDFSE